METVGEIEMALRRGLLLFAWVVLAQTPVHKSAILLSTNKIEMYIRLDPDKIPIIHCTVQRRKVDLWSYCFKQTERTPGVKKEELFENSLFFPVFDEYIGPVAWCVVKPGEQDVCISVRWNADETWEVKLYLDRWADSSMKVLNTKAGQFTNF